MTEKAERIEIWRALSDLFLDTEIDEVSFKYIARVIKNNNFTLSEVEHILWQEVYPVLEGNLRSVAGVWAGWPDEWLLQNMSISQEARPIHGDPSIIGEIKRCWDQVLEQFPNSKNA